MAKTTKVEGGVPIIGEKKIDYPIGDPTEPGAAVTLQLNVTPEQAAQMFGSYVQKRRAMGKGLPEQFTLQWIAASKGQSFLMREHEALRKRFEELESKVATLESSS